ncbi:hypothetical protein PUNSTDRAFT_57376 [Punctularia strigosozonata HHB-11173 SS5]|uniref:uncharacterized protein n=1 Tax=Punctularia strigosozonata (strain HHB-11173) TaxID=741275 RepID=UPI0004416F5E|nr:uncharacterized protein PUNSTDRAFT_57376 [Punctularia strigosozonata HHB-11173 SS5]EIN14028.1 hypothetical protein PUNSTDRAFT_57376 [Punctularia strigosozonata HHB-11173 SS5]
MDSTTKLTKKQRKAFAFRERKTKNKKKESDDPEEQAVPVMEDQDMAEVETLAPQESLEGEPSRSGTKRSHDAEAVQTPKEAGKSGKKRKHDERGVVEETSAVVPNQDPAEAPRSAKKRRREQETTSSADGVEEASNPSKPRKQKYILFAGNLKYTTTKEAIAAHFSCCEPQPRIRLQTPKTDKPNIRQKTKGFAFLEFDEKKPLQQALKMHLSVLDGRKINVELTVGGGGKSEARITKLRERNKELHAQRQKRIEKRNSESKEGEEHTRLEAPQRHSKTSGVEHTPATKRTWSVLEVDDGLTHRGGKKHARRPQKNLGTGVNSIPVG